MGSMQELDHFRESPSRNQFEVGMAEAEFSGIRGEIAGGDEDSPVGTLRHHYAEEFPQQTDAHRIPDILFTLHEDALAILAQHQIESAVRSCLSGMHHVVSPCPVIGRRKPFKLIPRHRLQVPERFGMAK